jgi:hypothetical protein
MNGRTRQSLSGGNDAGKPGSAKVTAGNSIKTCIATTATTLEELAELRTIARRGLADAQAAGDDYSLRAWTLVQSKILGQSAETEERLLAIAQDQGQLLTVGQALEAFGSVLMDVRKLLDAAPSALAAKVNPGDPDHSRAILGGWLRGVLRTLHRGEEGVPGHRL